MPLIAFLVALLLGHLVLSGAPDGNPTSALVRLERAATADDAVGSGTQVGIDLVDEWGDYHF